MSKIRHIQAYFATVLAGIYPFASDMARNFQLFSPRQICLTTLAVWLGLSALFALVCAGFKLLDGLTRRQGRAVPDRLKEAVFALLIAFVFFTFFYDKNVSALRQGFGLSNPLVALGLALLLVEYVALVFFLKPKWIAAGFVAGILVHAAWSGLKLAGVVGSGEGRLVTGYERMVYEKVRLTRKPNIYWLYAESYHGEQAMKDLYGFDNGPFLDFLRGEGFAVSGPMYANYWYTVASLHSSLLMGHHYFDGAFGIHDSVYVRGFLSGAGTYFNPVLRILKRNGYYVSYLLPSDYYYRPGAGVVDYSLLERSWPLAPLTVSIRSFMGREPYTNVEGYELKMRTYISSWTSHQPAFFLLETGLDHTPEPYRYQSDRKAWVAHYVDQLKDANRRIEELCSLIIAKDPSAVIILAGDHGAQSYKDTQRNLPKYMYEDDLPLRLIGQDYFEVILAIRWGEGMKPAAYPFHSLANVMRFVFYRLSDDETLLKTAAEDVSYLYAEGVINEVVRDGIPLDEWRVLKRAR